MNTKAGCNVELAFFLLPLGDLGSLNVSLL